MKISTSGNDEVLDNDEVEQSHQDEQFFVEERSFLPYSASMIVRETEDIKEMKQRNERKI